MPRKGPAAKHPVIVDPVYGSPIVTSLVNKILTGGKKPEGPGFFYPATVIDNTNYKAFDILDSQRSCPKWEIVVKP